MMPWMKWARREARWSGTTDRGGLRRADGRRLRWGHRCRIRARDEVLWLLDKPTEQAAETLFKWCPNRPCWWEVTQEFPLHDYRTIGARALVEIAEPYGWKLNSGKRSDPHWSVHLQRLA